MSPEIPQHGRIPGHKNDAIGAEDTFQDRMVIACTGHRYLPDERVISMALSSALQSAAGRFDPASVTAVSSIAIGADMLFAQAAIRRGIPWVAILPMPEAHFRTDFTANQWTDACKCLQRAKAILQAVDQNCDVDWTNKETREDGYREAGMRMVDAAHVLIAVWDGLPARGRGGTAEVVEYARVQEKPIIIISPKTGKIG